jgi:hypothetical protein
MTSARQLLRTAFWMHWGTVKGHETWASRAEMKKGAGSAGVVGQSGDSERAHEADGRTQEHEKIVGLVARRLVAGDTATDRTLASLFTVSPQCLP